MFLWDKDKQIMWLKKQKNKIQTSSAEIDALVTCEGRGQVNRGRGPDAAQLAQWRRRGSQHKSEHAQ